MRIAASLIVPLVAWSVACGGGGKGARPPVATPTPKLEHAVKDLTDDQMALLVLPLADYGPRYGFFELNAASGLISLTQRANQACSPSKEAAAMGKFGWTRGFAVFFTPPLDTGSDTLSIGSNIDVYSTDAKAQEKLVYDSATVRDDARSANGCYGFAVEGVDDLPITGIGEQVIAVRERFSVAGVRGSTSILAFRRGPVVASVTLYRLSAEDATAELIALAKKIDAKLAPLLAAPLS